MAQAILVAAHYYTSVLVLVAACRENIPAEEASKGEHTAGLLVLAVVVVDNHVKCSPTERLHYFQ